MYLCVVVGVLEGCRMSQGSGRSTTDENASFDVVICKAWLVIFGGYVIRFHPLVVIKSCKNSLN